ncbi:class I SAM-dependent methyltransferase [Desulfogranum mediterraneum]|uniref:class I SAM-dependent methyltransferase n=1 Tax=Desulfogranum mediterraneum TaxID=160661 RepID=UPI0004025027|nr:class I SAM-dependent methyltransferase [Desulfogranum mediterraneum]
MDDPKRATQRLAKRYADKGDPDGWFDEFYTRAGGDVSKIYWADLKPNPLLLAWIQAHPSSAECSALTIGCGLGDDAEALSEQGYQVTAFDISRSAIGMCRQRYPDSRVDYQVVDLFSPPRDWYGSFDLVYECNTIQILSGENRVRAVKAIAALLAPGGSLLVSCRSREGDDQADGFPVPLDRQEINGFRAEGLIELHFSAYDDDQDPPVPHFFAVYQRPA